jgi:hypothetical protein
MTFVKEINYYLMNRMLFGLELSPAEQKSSGSYYAAKKLYVGGKTRDQRKTRKETHTIAKAQARRQFSCSRSAAAAAANGAHATRVFDRALQL